MDRLATTSVVCLAVALAPASAAAWCQMRSQSPPQVGPTTCVQEGVPLAWRRRCIGYGVDMRGSESLDVDVVQDVVFRSFLNWLSVPCIGGDSIDLDVRPFERNSVCSLAEFNGASRNVNTVAFVQDWESRTDSSGAPYDPNAIAVTTVWFDTGSGEIVDADMLLNEDFGPYLDCPDSGCPTQGTVPTDLESIVTHEAGHFFGIAHSEVIDATMWFDYTPGSVDKRDLHIDDVTAICSIYPPNSLPESCSFEPRGGLDLECETPKSNGCGIGFNGAKHRRGHFILLAILLHGLLRRRRIGVG